MADGYRRCRCWAHEHQDLLNRKVGQRARPILPKLVLASSHNGLNMGQKNAINDVCFRVVA